MYISTAAFHLIINNKKSIAIILCVLLTLVANTVNASHKCIGINKDLDHFLEKMAYELVENCTICRSKSYHVLLVNLVDLSQLHCTSRFGQLVPERLRGLLQEKGFRVVEARRGLTIKVQRNTGQFILTDEVSDLATKVNCSAVLAGTYLFHGGEIFVNLKLISIPQNELISSATGKFFPDTLTTSLLQPIGFGCKTSKAFIAIKPFGEKKTKSFSDSEETLKEEYHD